MAVDRPQPEKDSFWKTQAFAWLVVALVGAGVVFLIAYAKHRNAQFAASQPDPDEAGIPTEYGDQRSIRGLSIAPDGKHALMHWELLEIRDLANWKVTILGQGPNQSFPQGQICGEFSADGNFVVSGGNGGHITIWDLKTNKGVRSFKAHGGRVNVVAMSPDGSMILSAGADLILNLWNAATGQLIRSFGPAHFSWRLAWSPDGKWAMSAAQQIPHDEQKPIWIIKVWDVVAGKLVCNLNMQSADVTALAFSPNGKLALSASADGTVHLWSVPKWREIRKLDWTGTTRAADAAIYPKAHRLSQAIFTPDSRYILTAGFGSLLLSEVASGKVALTFRGYSRGAVKVAMFPDGDRVLALYPTLGIVWNLRTGEEIRSFPRGKKDGKPPAIEALTFLPDSDQLVTNSWEGVTLWDLKRGQRIRTMPHFFFSSSSVSADGKTLLSCAPIGTWNLATGRSLWTAESYYHRAVLSLDGRLAIADGHENGKAFVDVWDTSKRMKVAKLAGSGIGAFLENVPLLITPDNKYAVSKTFDRSADNTFGHKIRIWDLTTNEVVRVLDDPVPGVHSDNLSLSNDGKLIFSRHEYCRTWDFSSGKLLETLKPFRHYAHPLAYSRDGTLCFVPFQDFSGGEIWSIETGKIVRPLASGKGPLRNIRVVEFSPDGNRIAAAGEQQLLRVWDVATGRLLWDFSGPPAKPENRNEGMMGDN